MGSTGRSGPSSEDSGEKPDFDSGAGSSGKPTRRSKRKRGQYRHKKQCEDSPDVEVPLTIDEEVSLDDEEPPEKRGREERADDGMILSLLLYFCSLRDFCLDPLLSFLFAEDDDLVMPEAPADEATTDPNTTFEEEPRDSGVDPESSPGTTSLLPPSFF